MKDEDVIQIRTLPNDGVADPYRAFVSGWCRILAARGVNLARLAKDWSTDYLQGLRNRGADLEISELLRQGCESLPLAATMKAAILLPMLSEDLFRPLGSAREVKRMIAEITRAAETFENLARRLTLGESTVVWQHPGIPSPSKMAEHLRAHAALFGPLEGLREAINARTLRDAERAALTSYVKRKTGEWHDREVSAVIGAATGEILDEGTHRKWRNRNFAEANKAALDVLTHLAEILSEEQDK